MSPEQRPPFDNLYQSPQTPNTHNYGTPQPEGAHGLFRIQAPGGFAIFERPGQTPTSAETTPQREYKTPDLPWIQGAVSIPYEHSPVNITDQPALQDRNGQAFYLDDKQRFWTTGARVSNPAQTTPAKEALSTKATDSPSDNTVTQRPEKTAHVPSSGHGTSRERSQTDHASAGTSHETRQRPAINPELQRLRSGLREEFNKDVRSEAQALIEQFGGRAQRHDIYKTVKSAQVLEMRKLMNESLAEYRSGMDDDRLDVLDQAAITIQSRYYRQIDQQNPDVQFPKGTSHIGDTYKYMVTLLDHPAMEAPAAVAKAEKVLKLLITQGCESMAGNTQGRGERLQKALELVKVYAIALPDFDIGKAGLFEAKVLLKQQLAAIDADSRTKPNYASTGRVDLPQKIANKACSVQAQALYRARGGREHPTAGEESKGFTAEAMLTQNFEASLTEVKRVQAELIDRIGWRVGPDAAKKINFFEHLRGEEGRLARAGIFTKLNQSEANLSKDPSQYDVFDRVVNEVSNDILLKRDEAGFRAGHELLELAKGHHWNNPEEVAKAAKVISLLVTTGIYKLNKWGASDQMSLATTLLVEYTKNVPGFEPLKAGYEEAKFDILNSLAAIGADFESKPDFVNSHPERVEIMKDRRVQLMQLLRTDLLRTQRPSTGRR
ncbi:MAG TPA: hypothetical protein VF733_02425 [Candidatus Saccharimonadales bacterium]